MITEYHPPRMSCAVSVGLSGVSLILSAVSEISLMMGLFGCILIGTGLYRGTHFIHRVGTIALTGGLMIGVLSGLLLEIGFVATMSLFGAYDIGADAISLGYYIEERASATRIELVRITQTLSGTILVGSMSYLALFLSPREPSIVALVVLLLGLITYAFNSDTHDRGDHESKPVSRH